jgi:hypothetical protein
MSIYLESILKRMGCTMLQTVHLCDWYWRYVPCQVNGPGTCHECARNSEEKAALLEHAWEFWLERVLMRSG